MPENTYSITPRITVKGFCKAEARNKILRLLAAAELSGEIAGFTVPMPEKKVF